MNSDSTPHPVWTQRAGAGRSETGGGCDALPSPRHPSKKSRLPFAPWCGDCRLRPWERMFFLQLLGSGVEEGRRFEGFSLVVPVVSVGNLGQLSTDVLLATGVSQGLGVESVGFLESRLVLPVTGHEAYDRRRRPPKPQLCNSLELYCVKARRVCLLQQR
jgi:hypothetical protein